jgi:hypothetical protein
LRVRRKAAIYPVNGEGRLTQTLANSGPAAQFPSVGRWGVTSIPSGWVYVADFGIRQARTAPGEIVACVSLGQETLDADSGLAEYIEKQKKLIGSHLKEAKFAGPQATAFAGADEAQLLFVRHSLDTVGFMLHAQSYVRLGRWLGIVTLTTPETKLREVRPDYEAFVKGLQIQPEQAVDLEMRSY